MMLLLVAALALASTGADKSSQSVGPFRYLVGTWHVVSVDPAGGDDLRVCYSVEPFVGEKWISGVATSKTPGFGSKDVWGFDGASGELFRTIFDASGTYAVVRSPGWKGDTMMLEGDARSGKVTMRVRETIRRLSENEFRATWETRRGGKWSVYAIETATRAPDRKCSPS
jgi:hypothetical protein